jgi:RHS repeat-associated protein
MQYDGSTIKVYYDHARSYDPATGRFLQEDPLGLAAGDVNVYRYVGNGPTNFIDPSGLKEYYDGGDGATNGAQNGPPGDQVPKSDDCGCSPAPVPSTTDPPGGYQWPWWEGTKDFLLYYPSTVFGWIFPANAGPNFNAAYRSHEQRMADITSADGIQKFNATGGSRAGFGDGGYVPPDVANDGMHATGNFSAATGIVNPTLGPGLGRLSGALRESGLPNAAFKFNGARRIDSLRHATHADIVKAFEGTCLTPTGHFISRIKDPRLTGLGLHNFKDLESVIRYGTPVCQDGGTVALVYGRLAIIIDPVRKTLVTIQPW